jgi:hypothetical protein
VRAVSCDRASPRANRTDGSACSATVQ